MDFKGVAGELQSLKMPVAYMSSDSLENLSGLNLYGSAKLFSSLAHM